MIITLVGEKKGEIYESSFDINPKASDKIISLLYRNSLKCISDKNIKPTMWIFWDKYNFEKADISEKKFIKLALR